VKRNVVWCPKSKHRLAWVEADQTGGLIVVVQAALAEQDGVTAVQGRIPESAFTDDEGPVNLGTEVTCPCGGLWSIELLSVLKGEPQTLLRNVRPGFPGVSLHRKRRSGT